MQTIHISMEANEGTVQIRMGIDAVGESTVPELLVYAELIKTIQTMLYAMTGAKSVQDSIDAANEVIAFMEKIIEVRVMGKDDIVITSGETFSDALESLFDEYGDDQKSACTDLLSWVAGESGATPTLVDKDAVNKALEELVQKVMDGTLGEEENVDAPGTPAKPVFYAN